MCSRWWYSCGKDPFNLCPSLQQARQFITIIEYTCADRVGHRSISNLQRCMYRTHSTGSLILRYVERCCIFGKSIVHVILGAGTVMGSCWQCECFITFVGHIRRSWEGSSLRIRSIGCGAAVLFDSKPDIVEELSGNVVSGNPPVLPWNASHFSRM